MKKLLLLSLLFCLTQTKAQFVTIPDTAFVSYLNIIVPTAMSGNQMDTTSALVTTTTHTINVSKKHIASLTGIQYFTSLAFLRCDSNQLTTLPTLPASLNYLKCNNQFYDSSGYTITTFTSLPTLPNSLIYLDCSSNNISNLPVLPNSLTYLNCSRQFYSTPHSYGVVLTSLPALPASLTYLNCSANIITALPPLPSTLKYLDCGYTIIANLPALPNALTHLSCNNIEVATFTTLPALPNSLSFLDCSKHYCVPCMGNPPPQGLITTLPALPNHLDTLMCGYNSITCFQPFPTSITFIDISDNNNYCLPNYLPAMSRSDTINFPLCGIGSPCPTSPTCTNTVSFSLTPDATPHVWDVYPTYPSNVVKATWYWGNGAYTTNSLFPSHTYTTPGSYQICVQIIDSLNCITDFCQTDSVYRYANNSAYSNMVQINVLSNVTDISQTTNNTQLNIYPNPANNKITIDATNIAEVKLFDVLGKQITSTKQNQMDVSNLPEGVYFIQVQNNQNTATQKIIIQH